MVFDIVINLPSNSVPIPGRGKRSFFSLKRPDCFRLPCILFKDTGGYIPRVTTSGVEAEHSPRLQAS